MQIKAMKKPLFNITSTPSLIINEKKYSAMSYETFEKIIESLIN